MPTFSINTNTPTMATNWDNINIVLSELPDNTTELINPINIRDAIYTTYESIAFKPTTNNSSIEYIGLENVGVNGLYEQILLGKKQVSGIDTLNLNLLNSDIDLFFYNIVFSIC